MRTFTTYIEYLLMTRHYCYVPGVGAYMMSDEPAHISTLPSIGADSRRQHNIEAPRRVVRFSPLHTHDDGMLANLLMEAEGMTYDEACRYIERQAPLLSTDFAESASLHTDTDNYGFESLHLETWADIEARQQAATRQEASGTAVLGNRNAHETIAIPKYWLKRAAMVLLIAIIFFTNFIGLNRSNTQLASVLNVNALQHCVSTATDSEESCQGSPAIVSSSLMTQDLIELGESEASLLNNTSLYYLIVECTTSESYAEEALARYHRMGFDKAGILTNKRGNCRIFAECYTDRSEALVRLRSIRKSNSKLSKTWLMPVEDASLSSYSIKNIYNDNQLSLELSHPNQRTERDQG